MHPSGVEQIEISVYLPSPLANAFKYIWRYEEKGMPEKDLNKAIFYIEKCLQMNKKFMIVSLKLSKQMFVQDKDLMRKLDAVIDAEQNRYRQRFMSAIASMMSDILDENQAYDSLANLKVTLEMAEAQL
jgi:hypothetical protein